MAYDGWIEFNGQEFVNHARTARVARALGLNTVRIREELTATLEGRFLGSGFGTGGFGMGPFGEAADEGYYADITKAPWYDEGVPASAEFAGIVSLGFRGLDDSTLSSASSEYITDGGHSGNPRNAMLIIVASVALVATTERGAEYGKRWMNSLLRNSGSRLFCQGTDLTYLRYVSEDAPLVHRRDVRLTRGVSITRKKVSRCSSTWLATFTLTAGDPYEYGVPAPQVESIGGDTATGPTVDTQGSLDLVEASCPIYDYTPIYDPLYPALIPSPTAPNFLPDGWGIEDGMAYRRKWARLDPFEPSLLYTVPMVTLTSGVEARMVRFCIWPSTASEDEQCEPLFAAIVTYLPPDTTFYIHGEQKAAYAWDGFTPAVRRTDSLVYGPEATPIEWTTLSDPEGLLVTLDVFEDEDGFQGDGSVRASLHLIPKSD